MKFTDYVVQFIAELGVKHVFLVSGGAAIHLVDSINKRADIDYICNNHEQACAMAADGYSRGNGNIGVAISTSGPGATNMLTGVCGAYYDSVPVLYITGQVTTWRLKGDSGVRQVGFQETDVIDIYKSVTKYATMIRKPEDIKYELQKAVHIATSGRKGPVLIDLPDDLQRSEIDPSNLREFVPELEEPSKLDVAKCIDLLRQAEKPLVVFGNGVKLSGAEREAVLFVEKLGLPVLQTWTDMDVLPFNHPLNAGSFGQHGSKYGNVAIQNSDLLFVLGSRIDTHMTGSILDNFAPKAKKIIVDIDACEINRLPHDVGIVSDVKIFLDTINEENLNINDISKWRNQIDHWKKQYPTVLPSYYEDIVVNPYVFFKKMSECVKDNDLIAVDTGSALAWFMQAFEFSGQKVFSDFNNTAMGWCLPASMGLMLSTGKRVIAVMGDGALQMNIQELSTVKLHNLPIKIFVISNKGYSMIRQTQDDWLKSEYEASTSETIGFPDFVKVANAYGLRTVDINTRDEITSKIMEVLNDDDPVFCNVNVPDSYRIYTVVKFGESLDGGSYGCSRSRK